MVGEIRSWELIGIISAVNGLTEPCELYSIVGISTCKLADQRLVDWQAVH